MADNKSRIEKAKKAHTEANKARAEKLNELRVSYKKIKDTPAFKDILYMLQHLADLHSKMAKDGVGYRDTGQKSITGVSEQELIYFTPEKRVGELDRAAGLEEGVGYIERQITDDALKPVTPKKVVA